MLNCQFTDATWHSCIYDYQTLIVGIFAVLSALVTGGLLWRQINQQQKHRDDERDRRLRSARAMLPHALSGLIDYTEQCIELGKKLYHDAKADEVAGNVEDRNAPTVPTIDPSIMSVVRDCLEQADEAAADALIHLFRNLQVQKARLHNRVHAYYGPHREDIVRMPDIYGACERIIDAAEIHAEVEALFEYARFNAEAPEPINALERASLLLHFKYIDEVGYPELAKIIEGRLHPKQE